MPINLTNYTEILKQIPDILIPIPGIVISVGTVVMYGIILALIVRILWIICSSIDDLIKVKK